MAEAVDCFALLEGIGSLSNELLVFGVAEVWFDNRHHADCTNEPIVLCAVESRVESKRDILERPTQSESGVGEFFKRTREQNRIVGVH